MRHLYIISIWFWTILAWFLQLTTRFFRRIGVLSPTPRPGDQSISAMWLSDLFHKKKLLKGSESISKVIVNDLEGNRGLTGRMLKLELEYQSIDEDSKKSVPKTLILKTNYSTSFYDIRRGLCLNQWREAAAYQIQVSKDMPKHYYAYGSRWTGESVILMEDLSGREGGTVGVNFLFGNQCWGVPPLERTRSVSSILIDIAHHLADYHAVHWNNASLKSKSWLKASDWYKGKGRDAWEVAVEETKRAWERGSKVAEANGVKINPRVAAMMDKSLKLTSWEYLQRRLNDPDIPFTLTHGDFHASNMMWAFDGHLLVYDWSEVGIWSPMADLGQLMISDVTPSDRRKYEKDTVRAYWERLISNGVLQESFPWSKCWTQYQLHSLERWIFMLALLIDYPLPTVALQYFHDQVEAFWLDHCSSLDAIPLTTVATLPPT